MVNLQIIVNEASEINSCFMRSHNPPQQELILPQGSGSWNSARNPDRLIRFIGAS